MTRSRSRLSVALLVLGAACAGEGENVGVDVSRAVIAEPVLGERTVLYFDVSNARPEPDTLLDVDVGDLGAASLHASEIEDGVSRMRPRAALELPPSGRVELRPGGLHVMIEGLSRPLSVGDTVVFSVRLARAGIVTARAPVVAYADLLEALDSGP